MSKKKKPKKRREKRPVMSSMPRQLRIKLAEAADLLDRRRPEAAREILDELNRRYPRRIEVLAELGFACHQLGNYPSSLRAYKDLVEVAPKADFVLALAGAYSANLFFFLALRTFQRFLERWPDHPRAAEVRQQAADLERDTAKLLTDLHISGDDAREVAVLHEEVQAFLARGEYAKVRQTGEQLLQRRPEFPAAFNNMAEAAIREGKADEAVALCRRVLAFAPDNVHGLSNLARNLLLSGRMDEARAAAEQLKTVEAKGWDPWTKKAEALSYLGDDAAVLDALHGYERSAHELKLPRPLLYHLAAVAACRLGREDEARGYWKKALREMPGLGLARANIADLDQPIGERHAPWAFDIASWIPEKTTRELSNAFQSTGQRTSKPAESEALRRYLHEYPALVALTPMLLDRGDPAGRGFALNLARTARTPELLAALRDFALGQRGPDAQRFEAAQVAAEAGLLPRDNVRFWGDGAWGEVMLMAFEVHEEPSNKHSPPVQALALQAWEALHQDEETRAERLLKEALELEPDSPDLLNNLAQAYQGQGRQAEAEALIRQVHERFPDYFFGRITVSQLLAREGKLDEARQLLMPLLQRQRLHSSEFRALCHAHISIALEAGNRRDAENWLALWERAEPDYPMLEADRQRVRRPTLRQRVRNWLL